MTWAPGVSGNPRGLPKKQRIVSATSRCAMCKETKPVSEFARNFRMLDGRASYCNSCKVIRVKDWRRRNPQRSREQSIRYQRRNVVVYLLSRIRYRARKIGVTCALTIEDVKRLIETKTCPVFGFPLEITIGSGATSGGKPNSLSFDRINPSLGYVPGNVYVISYRANVLKRDATLEELKQLVAWMETVSPTME